MSATYIFIAGSFIFAGTVWGALMVGGVALGRHMGPGVDGRGETPASEGG